MAIRKRSSRDSAEAPPRTKTQQPDSFFARLAIPWNWLKSKPSQVPAAEQEPNNDNVNYEIISDDSSCRSSFSSVRSNISASSKISATLDQPIAKSPAKVILQHEIDAQIDDVNSNHFGSDTFQTPKMTLSNIFKNTNLNTASTSSRSSQFSQSTQRRNILSQNRIRNGLGSVRKQQFKKLSVSMSQIKKSYSPAYKTLFKKGFKGSEKDLQSLTEYIKKVDSYAKEDQETSSKIKFTGISSKTSDSGFRILFNKSDRKSNVETRNLDAKIAPPGVKDKGKKSDVDWLSDLRSEIAKLTKKRYKIFNQNS
jgi:hypothetical protein